VDEKVFGLLFVLGWRMVLQRTRRKGPLSKYVEVSDRDPEGSPVAVLRLFLLPHSDIEEEGVALRPTLAWRDSPCPFQSSSFIPSEAS
jgi:hypothetical protein